MTRVTLDIIHEIRDGSLGRAVVQAVGVRSITEDARIQSQVSPCGIFGGQSGTGAGFSSSTSVSPVSVILPLLLAHSFIYTDAI